MTLKLYDIDTYLSLPGEVQVKINNLEAFFIREIARYYGSDLEDSIFFTSTEIKRNGVTLILNSKPKQV